MVDSDSPRRSAGEEASPDSGPPRGGRDFPVEGDQSGGPWTTHLEQLAELGIRLPPPESLDDHALSYELERVVHGLASLGVYLFLTDHLTDRALYEELFTSALRVRFRDVPLAKDQHHTIWMLGGSDESLKNYLRVYATDAQRRRWQGQGVDVPPREEPVSDRDRRLPHPPGPPPLPPPRPRNRPAARKRRNPWKRRK